VSVTTPNVTPVAPGIFFRLADLGLPTSQQQFLSMWLAAMQAAYPDYTPAQGNLEVLQAQVFASWAAAVAQLCNQGASELFRQYGLQLIGLPYQQGVAAQTTVTVTAADTLGHFLPAASQLTLTQSNSQVGFLTATPLTIPAGQQAGTVVVIAAQTGVAFNGASGPAQLISQTDWVTGVSVTSPAQGGVDPEDDDHYLIRLAATLQTLAPRPITAQDYATISLDFQPQAGTDQQQIGRAAAVDGYDPPTNTYGNEREVTVCVTDQLGNAVNQDTMSALQAWLVSMREINFLVNVVAPNYTTLYVSVTVAPAGGWAPQTVAANVQQAVLSYLNPQTFGLPVGVNVGWETQQQVYLSRVEAVIQQAAGVDHIQAGSLAVDVNPQPSNTTQDLLLPGAFPLPVTTTQTVPLSAITVL
jgi:hypothetical protein